MGEAEMEEGWKRDGEIKAEREGGGWRFTQEKLSVAGVKKKKKGRKRDDIEEEEIEKQRGEDGGGWGAG